MPRMPLNLVRGDSAGSDTDYRDALPVNMTAVLSPKLGAAGYMIQEPGLRAIGTGQGADRGGIFNSRLTQHFRVSGNQLIQLNASGFTSNLGEIPGRDNVTMTYSFNTQAIIADGRYYLYDSVNGLRDATGDRLARDGVWIRGVYLLTDGEDLYHTALDDETEFPALAFGTAEFIPDGIVAVDKTSDNKAIVFGRYSTQYFRFDASNENFFFTDLPTRATKTGIVGKDAKAEIEGEFYILGGERDENVSIRRLGVNHSPRVATREVEKIIGQYSELQLQSAVLEARVRNGYSYLIVHLPQDTLIFNATLAKAVGIDQAWSILKTDVTGTSNYRGIHGVFDQNIGAFVYGDKRSNNIGVLDDDTALHFGAIVEWELNTPFFQLDGQSIDRFEVEMLPGFNDEGDANVFVSLTYEGVTHGREYSKSYGKAAVYDQRFICRRLGYVRDWTSIKMRGATRSRMAFSRAYVDHG